MVRNTIARIDGRTVVFSSARDGDSALHLYALRLDGDGQTRRLTVSANSQFAAAWHPSGKFLPVDEQAPDTGFDVMLIPMEPDGPGWRAGPATAFQRTRSSIGTPSSRRTVDGSHTLPVKVERTRFTCGLSMPGWQVAGVDR